MGNLNQITRLALAGGASLEDAVSMALSYRPRWHRVQCGWLSDPVVVSHNLPRFDEEGKMWRDRPGPLNQKLLVVGFSPEREEILVGDVVVPLEDLSPTQVEGNSFEFRGDYGFLRLDGIYQLPE